MLRRLMPSALPHELRLLSTALQPSRRPLGTLLLARHQHQQRAPHHPPIHAAPHSLPGSLVAGSARAFHISARREIPAPLALLAVLKSSTILAGVTTLSRVLISFLPLPIAAHLIAERKLALLDPKYRAIAQRRLQASDEAWRLHDAGGIPPADASPSLLHELERIRKWEARRGPLERKRNVTALIGWVMIGIPLLAFLVAVAAGLEQTPVTGRWRLILLSPMEEEILHDALSGPGWFEHVLRLLKPTAADPTPVILPANDWRWAWVESTLRALERGAQDAYERDLAAHDTGTAAAACAPKAPLNLPFPPPPPPPYPLRPRPRMSQMLHHSLPPPSTAPAANAPPADVLPHEEHELLGPPYSLLLLEATEANAFSYGFSSEGAAGIVVNTGILDEILRSSSSSAVAAPSSPVIAPVAAPAAERSWLSYLLPGLGSSRASKSGRSFAQPTEEQTLHLAAVLAHEMAHLLLTHHLESLSQRQILLPSMFNLGVDIVRTILFPITWVLGPFVNDGIAALSRTGETEMAALGSNCSNRSLEVEADLVGLRIMAHAGFNPYEAARFWAPDHAPTPSTDRPPTTPWASAWRTLSSGFGLSHPSNEVRSEAVSTELASWRKIWQESQQQQQQHAGVVAP